MKTSTKDSLDRAIRTWIQAFTGVIIAQSGSILLSANSGQYVLDIDWIKRILLSAVVAAVISVVTLGHNLAESAGLPTILKPTDRAIGEAVLKGDVAPPVVPKP